jgi:hypothetical protein
MLGTDPRIGPSTQLLAATMAAGFGSVAAVVALALTGSSLITMIGGATPMMAVMIGSLNYTDAPDRLRESYDNSTTDMTDALSTDGGIDDK